MAQPAPHPASLLEALARYDTPTICNAMEVVAPERRLGLRQVPERQAYLTGSKNAS